MIGDTVKLDYTDKRRVLALVEQARKDYANYDAYAAQEKALGLNPHYCFHGRDRWTEADIWCGSCEEGEGQFDYLRELGAALSMVRSARREVDRRMEPLKAMLAISDDAPIFGEAFAWAIEPMEALVTLNA